MPVYRKRHDDRHSKAFCKSTFSGFCIGKSTYCCRGVWYKLKCAYGLSLRMKSSWSILCAIDRMPRGYHAPSSSCNAEQRAIGRNRVCWGTERVNGLKRCQPAPGSVRAVGFCSSFRDRIPVPDKRLTSTRQIANIQREIWQLPVPRGRRKRCEQCGSAPVSQPCETFLSILMISTMP